MKIFDLDKMIKELDESDPLFFVKAKWISFVMYLNAMETNRKCKKIIKDELKKMGKESL